MGNITKSLRRFARPTRPLVRFFYVLIRNRLNARGMRNAHISQNAAGRAIRDMEQAIKVDQRLKAMAAEPTRTVARTEAYPGFVQGLSSHDVPNCGDEC